MKVCYFGIYDPAYSRNKVNLRGLAQRGIEVVEVNERTAGLSKWWRLFLKLRQVEKDVDAVIVGFPGQLATFVARCATRKPIILDLFVSYYDSIIIERKKYSRHSVQALWFYALDYFSVRCAQMVLMDTNVHARYAEQLLRLRPESIRTVYVGIDDTLFSSREEKHVRSKPFVVSFHGNIQILNGMEYVIEAFRKLAKEDIVLWVIGGGSEYPRIQKLAESYGLKNVLFFGRMEPAVLAAKVRLADIGVGFFSDSKKIDRVIPNKAYEMMGLRVPFLTGESVAMKELFTHGEHAFYVPRQNSEALAQAILTLRDNDALRTRIAEQAYAQVMNRVAPPSAVAPIVEYLEKAR